MTDTQKLYRIPEEGVIAGVCAGLADYFDIDVTLIRVIFVVLTFAGAGFGVLLYILLAILTPTKGSKGAAEFASSEDFQDGKDSLRETGENLQKTAADIKENLSGSKIKLRNYLGIGLVLFGIWLLLEQFMPDLFIVDWNYVWPVFLVLLGLMILSKRK
ncbi:MAG: PspC domain-containing protein [Candidatus Saccharimonadales bacterium]